MQGKDIIRKVLKNPKSGNNIIELYNGSDKKNAIIAKGIYVLRMSVIYENATHPAVFEKALMRL
jgi:hypothetical protein